MLKQITFVVLAAVGLASCGGGKSEEAGSTEIAGNISIDGSSTVFPLSEAMAEEFGLKNPKARVTVGESGTGGGFKKFGRGEIDICGASRPIKDSEKEICDSAGIKYLELEVAYDGLAVVVNKENTWVDKLTTAELKIMWETAAQGKITSWKQVRASFPDEPLHLYGAGTASGTFDYFTEEICGKKGESRGDYTASENDNTLVTGVAGDKGGLAYFGMAYYENNKEQLKIVPIDNGSGTGVIPTQETVLNKSYAPLSRPLYIYVSEKAMARPEVQAFVSFFIDNAPVLSKEVGYVPCEASIYETQKGLIKASMEKNAPAK
ncbi:MAG: PstS family phosphate ABC transporter substrate-binding protein [Chitinophagales bacterium]|jgi:phosphate transport system substrate-binding protein|nr:PstS family phosphate ABC transporter substrate-binding protein [Bacteroidota bacterium]MBP8249577.1 PstS family phosphate ABC transporter substrate-binding protein [Chitinophagales bacterium]MBK9506140.1 PstS family phosphate ABC transporter substrate-binding protein [Bacteroidota bacterium]MBK9555373.1 PstS family phosphate ABC transporter substrate-binding protein [Bacteroidota bacterium]MBL0279696.1 PstS family phosphate ABC transporter substrate-binding protein [Bacteroidota bacterium]